MTHFGFSLLFPRLFPVADALASNTLNTPASSLPLPSASALHIPSLHFCQMQVQRAHASGWRQQLGDQARAVCWQPTLHRPRGIVCRAAAVSGPLPEWIVQQGGDVQRIELQGRTLRAAKVRGRTCKFMLGLALLHTHRTGTPMHALWRTCPSTTHKPLSLNKSAHTWHTPFSVGRV